MSQSQLESAERATQDQGLDGSSSRHRVSRDKGTEQKILLDQGHHINVTQSTIVTQSHPMLHQVDGAARMKPQLRLSNLPQASEPVSAQPSNNSEAKYTEDDPSLPTLHNLNSPYYVELERSSDYLSFPAAPKITIDAPQNTSIDTALASKIEEGAKTSGMAVPSYANPKAAIGVSLDEPNDGSNKQSLHTQTTSRTQYSGQDLARCRRESLRP